MLIGRSYLIAVIAVLLTVTIAFAGNWPFNNRRHYFIARDYIENLLSAIEPDGLLLKFDWQVASPMFYGQELEERRRDVKVADINLLRRSWYFDYLRHAYPGLIERSRDKIDTFVANLKRWETTQELLPTICPTIAFLLVSLRLQMRAKMSEQSANAVVMIRPSRFYPNPETALDNAFQQEVEAESSETLTARAQAEFDEAVRTLSAAAVKVHVFDDTPPPGEAGCGFP